jgi:hypothetical protein
MDGRAHYVEAERLLAEAERYGAGGTQEVSRLRKATAHALLAGAADTPRRRVDQEWCEACDGSGYADPKPKPKPQVAA